MTAVDRGPDLGNNSPLPAMVALHWVVAGDDARDAACLARYDAFRHDHRIRVTVVWGWREMSASGAALVGDVRPTRWVSAPSYDFYRLVCYDRQHHRHWRSRWTYQAMDDGHLDWATAMSYSLASATADWPSRYLAVWC